MNTVLIIDDETAIVETLKTYLEDNSYNVLSAKNAKEAYPMLLKKPDIILLDIMMPDIDGISLCREIREKTLCPIIFLSAKTEEASKIEGLNVGGDDYITKPFSLKELQARLDAHLRRENRPKNNYNRTNFDDFWIDYGSNEIGFNEKIISFTKKEYLIVELLTLNFGLTLSQEKIYEKVWGYDSNGSASTAVMEHIKRIRKKLQEYSNKDYIETVWGIGYRWKK